MRELYHHSSISFVLHPFKADLNTGLNEVVVVAVSLLNGVTYTKHKPLNYNPVLMYYSSILADAIDGHTIFYFLLFFTVK